LGRIAGVKVAAQDEGQIDDLVEDGLGLRAGRDASGGRGQDEGDEGQGRCPSE
jgi:hypothetical protein